MATLVIEHSPTCRLDRLGSVLSSYGHQLRLVRLHRGEALPGDLDDVDAIVSLGGPQSANGPEPWIAPQMALLKSAHDRQLPIVGLCLGSQILARALGGAVGPLEGAGIELGVHPVTLSPAGREDPLFTGIGWEHPQFHWHSEQVTTLPPGSRLLASSRMCKVQAWGLGLRTFGIQFHPEVYADTIRAWAKESPDELKQAGLAPADLDKMITEHYATIERLSLRLFESIALFVMPVDRFNAGIVKDLHH